MPGWSNTRHTNKPHSRRLAGLLCCLTLAAAATTVQTTPTAYAGTWTEYSCKLPGGQPAPTEGWRTSALGGVGVDSGDVNSCAEGGSLAALTSSEAPQTPYQGPEWIYDAPKGSTITGGTVTATVTAPHGQAWLATPNPSYDSADILGNCQYNLACGSAGSLAGAFPITHPGGSDLYTAAVCVGAYEGATSCPADGGLDAAVYVSATAIELTNNSTPAASDFTGALLDPDARGTQDLLFDASDPEGPGIYSITAQADTTTLYTGTPDNNGGDCVALPDSNGALAFDHAQPCPQSESVELPIDTTSLPDGPHTLKLTIQDAASNSSIVYDATITTNNAPTNSNPPTITTPAQPTIGTTLTAQPGPWAAPAGAGSITYSDQWQDCDPEGTNCQPITGADTASYTPTAADAGHTLRVVLVAADNDGTASASIAATKLLQAITSSPPAPSGPAADTPATPVGTPNGSGASENAILLIKRPATPPRSFAQSPLKLTGQLTDNQSRPIAGATLEVLEQTDDGNHTLSLLKHAQTSSTGALSITIPAGPSRLIEIVYRAFASDTTYTATATVHETVSANARLKISQPSKSPTSTIIFNGKVQGPIPRQGTLVQILVHWHGHWELIRNPRTNSNGTFHAEDQFQGSTGTFPFRAEIPAGQTNFPYTRGYSNTINITTTTSVR